MAHKTLIGGTAYEITGGKTLIDGTGYSISGGKTLIGGTGYDVSFGAPPLIECTPAEIQAVARSGKAANYWAIGDVVPITLNGTVGALTFSNKKYYAFIIGFDHNSGVEGSNTIHFQFGKTEDGTDIAFVDDDYDISDSSAGFRMNTSLSNSGGWESSYMRRTICPSFKSAMPTAWQNVIAACTKYSDNTGGGSDTASYVTSTSDKIWLLSEFEVHGARTYANSAEQNYQKQYDYYKNGNSNVKNKHNETTTTCYWWYRSVHAETDYRFCANEEYGWASYSFSDRSAGFSPGFKVA